MFFSKEHENFAQTSIELFKEKPIIALDPKILDTSVPILPLNILVQIIALLIHTIIFSSFGRNWFFRCYFTY